MSIQDKTTLTGLIASLFPNNTTGLITPAAMRQYLTDILDSNVLQAFGVVVDSTATVNLLVADIDENAPRSPTFAGTMTYNLPAVSSVKAGVELVVINELSETRTVVADGSDTIVGVTSIDQGGVFALTADTANNRWLALFISFDPAPVASVIVASGSHSVDQGPTATDTAHQVLFGAGGTITGDMTINANGSITCSTTGDYLFNTNLTYGRSTGVSFAEIFVRVLVDGSQIGGSGINRFNSADTRLTKLASFTLRLVAGEVFTMEIIRDSAGENDGGLFTSNPTAAGWVDVPSASVAIYKIVQ